MTHSDVLGTHNPLELRLIVADNMVHLKDKDKNIQKKGVKVLAALAQTGKHLFSHVV